MGALQKEIAKVLSRLRDVNVSQRIALLLGGVLVAVSLIWLAQWAATPDMVPLLDQDLDPEELALVQSGLEAAGQKHEVRGARVFVPAGANRHAIYAQLQQREKLPADTSVGFAALIKESDPWISGAENTRRWIYAQQKELEYVLRQFQGVKAARVFLNLNTGAVRFTRQEPPKSASVTLIMKHGEGVPRSLALAVARLVSGAVEGLPVHNVQVVDAAGRLAIDWNNEQDVATQLDRKVVQQEQRYLHKIRQILADPKALVSVQVELNMTSSNTETEQPLKGVPTLERSTREQTARGRRADQPGVQPNVGITAGSGALEEMHEKDTSDTEMQVGMARKIEATPAGDVEMVTAAISLSYSYLESVFRRTHPDIEAVTDGDVEQAFQQERTRLMGQVVRLVKPQEEKNVDISRYYDLAAAPVAAGPSGALDQGLDLLRSYGAQSGLGLLALVSLGLMLRMARRSDEGESFGLELGLPEEAIEAARQAASDVSTVAIRAAARPGGSPGAGPGGMSSVPVGVADVTAAVENTAMAEGMLVAREVDAGTVQTQKMLDQVAEAVDGNAEEVSTLVEHWMQRNEQYHEEAT